MAKLAHTHHGFELHDHGGSAFTAAEVAYLLRAGMHPEVEHGVVYGYKGRPMSPLVVSQKLAAARKAGEL
jgi:hypothetical protein